MPTPDDLAKLAKLAKLDEFFAKADNVLTDAEWQPPLGAARWTPDGPGDLDYAQARTLDSFPLEPYSRSDTPPDEEARLALTEDNAPSILTILQASPGALNG